MDLPSKIALGGTHTCIVSGGALRCFGYDGAGQLGDGSLTSGVVDVCAGDSHTCALLASGSVVCFGDNHAFQLGDGTNVASSARVTALASGATKIACGAFHSCAALSDGRLVCWGNNQSGQLGDGTTTSRATPTDVLPF